MNEMVQGSLFGAELYHVAALSGGKDSTAMVLELREREPNTKFIYVCTPTGNELPAMQAHWRRLEDRLGAEIIRIAHPLTLGDMIRQRNMIPNHRMRWCTEELKIRTFATFMSSLTERGNVLVYVGLRADEAAREGVTYGHIPGVGVRYPFREWGWGLRDVRACLAKHEVDIPIRTDCAWCFFQRLSEWWNLWKEQPDLYAEGEALEAVIGHTFRSPGRDTWPAGLAALRAEFEAGRMPKGTEGTALAAAKCRVCSL